MFHIFDFMEQQSNKGGKRPGAGRKPSSDPKISITVYVAGSRVKKHGGPDSIKAKILDFINGTDDRDNPLINAARGRDEDGINHDEVTNEQMERLSALDTVLVEYKKIINDPKPSFLNPAQYENSKNKRIANLFDKLK